MNLRKYIHMNIIKSAPKTVDSIDESEKQSETDMSTDESTMFTPFKDDHQQIPKS